MVDVGWLYACDLKPLSLFASWQTISGKACFPEPIHMTECDKRLPLGSLFVTLDVVEGNLVPVSIQQAGTPAVPLQFHLSFGIVLSSLQPGHAS